MDLRLMHCLLYNWFVLTRKFLVCTWWRDWSPSKWRVDLYLLNGSKCSDEIRLYMKLKKLLKGGTGTNQILCRAVHLPCCGSSRKTQWESCANGLFNTWDQNLIPGNLILSNRMCVMTWRQRIFAWSVNCAKDAAITSRMYYEQQMQAKGC